MFAMIYYDNMDRIDLTSLDGYSQPKVEFLSCRRSFLYTLGSVATGPFVYKILSTLQRPGQHQEKSPSISDEFHQTYTLLSQERARLVSTAGNLRDNAWYSQVDQFNKVAKEFNRQLNDQRINHTDAFVQPKPAIPATNGNSEYDSIKGSLLPASQHSFPQTLELITIPDAEEDTVSSETLKHPPAELPEKSE